MPGLCRRRDAVREGTDWTKSQNYGGGGVVKKGGGGKVKKQKRKSSY
tara:strand:- start:471 stop:611 length:141 start_codon:yes stop_codon:yes gene_type:complete